VKRFKKTAETLYGLIYPEVRRRVITEILEPALVFRKLLPVERYDTKTLKYYKVSELIGGIEEMAIEGGAAYPTTIEVIEEAELTLKRYGVAIPLDDWDVRHANFAIMRRNIEGATRAMARYEDKEIIANAITNATGINSFTSGGWTTATNVRPEVAEAIRRCREDNAEPDTMILSPRGYELLLNAIDVSNDWGARAALERGAIPTYMGLNVIVSNNMKVANEALVLAKNKFGWLAEAIPIRSDTEYIKRTKTHWIYLEAMSGCAIDQPTAICKITGIYT